MTLKCDNVISLKQYGPTCWFNSILMALLYSDESRKLLLKRSNKWNKKINVLNTINYILHNKYLRTDKIYKDYEYFDKKRHKFILKELYLYNNKKFNFNPDLNNKKGYAHVLYIRKMYKLLGVKVLYLDLNLKTKQLYYSKYNNVTAFYDNNLKLLYKYNFKSISTILKYFTNPDVIIIHITTKFIDSDYPLWYKINNTHYNNFNDINNFSSLNKKIINNNDIYLQDSVILHNYNNLDIGSHAIAGITCKGDKYVYNGWTRSTIDPNITNGINLKIPCELMKFNWNIMKNKEFCLNRKKCILDEMNIKDLCFSFTKGHRTVIYVKKNKTLSKPEKQCPEGKVLNPLTNRCNKIKTINKLPNKTLSKPEKQCPEGKVLNPLTNRCNKIKTINKLPNKTLSKPEKQCPEGKVLNPLTNRCNKIKTINKLL